MHTQVDLKTWQWAGGKEHMADEGTGFGLKDLKAMASSLPFDTEKLYDKIREPVQEKLQAQVDKKIRQNCGLEKKEQDAA